jgi:hypothetical protein
MADIEILSMYRKWRAAEPAATHGDQDFDAAIEIQHKIAGQLAAIPATGLVGLAAKVFIACQPDCFTPEIQRSLLDDVRRLAPELS